MTSSKISSRCSTLEFGMSYAEVLRFRLSRVSASRLSTHSKKAARLSKLPTRNFSAIMTVVVSGHKALQLARLIIGSVNCTSPSPQE